MPARLGSNRYGPPGIRFLKITRRSDRHDVKELSLDVRVEGAFEAAYVDGDNQQLLPADTIRNAVYALARDHPVEQVEEFGLALNDYFLLSHAHLTRVHLRLAEDAWARVPVSGRPHPHTFQRTRGERRTATVVGSREGTTVEAGIEELAVLRTAGAAFEGYIKDQFTTLEESADRILATTISARWSYARPDVTFGLYWHGIRDVLLETFAQHESRSLHHTVYALGEAVLQNYDEVTAVHLSVPLRPHHLLDLSRFGFENPGEIFAPAGESSGVIDAVVERRR